MSLSLVSAVSALVAGGLTFVAPCTLPLVPAYLGFISGIDTDSDQQQALTANQRRQIIKNGAAFVVGFSIVFILFGMLAGLIGQALSQWQTALTRVGGVFIILLGLVMVFDIRLSAFSGTGLNLPSWIQPGNVFSSLGVGATFAVGWTPCVGPVLGSVLLLASQEATVLSGGLLLAVFSLGLAVPFVLLAVFYAHISSWIQSSQQWITWVSRTGGVFLLLVGVLLFTNNFSLTIQYGYEWLDFINYKGLQQYL